MTRESFEQIIQPCLAEEIRSKAPTPLFRIIFLTNEDEIQFDDIEFFADFFIPKSPELIKLQSNPVDDEYVDEIYIPYSTITRIIFYRDRETGNLSGILIYAWPLSRHQTGYTQSQWALKYSKIWR